VNENILHYLDDFLFGGKALYIDLQRNLGHTLVIAVA
jgi:hypothetical protein